MEESGSTTPPFTAAPATAHPAGDEQTWVVLVHLAALSALITGIGAILGPLIVWLVQKEKYPTVDWHGKQALNFNLTIVVAYLVLVVFTFFVAFVTFGIGMILMMPVLLALGVFWLVCVVLAGMKASNREPYTYPFSFQFLK